AGAAALNFDSGGVGTEYKNSAFAHLTSPPLMFGASLKRHLDQCMRRSRRREMVCAIERRSLVPLLRVGDEMAASCCSGITRALREKSPIRGLPHRVPQLRRSESGCEVHPAAAEKSRDAASC